MKVRRISGRDFRRYRTFDIELAKQKRIVTYSELALLLP